MNVRIYVSPSITDTTCAQQVAKASLGTFFHSTLFGLFTAQLLFFGRISPKQANKNLFSVCFYSKICF